MKQLFVCLILFAFSPSAWAQAEKKVVAIMPFTYTVPQNKSTAAQVQEMVVKILSAKSDIELVDRSKDSLVLNELINQTRAESLSARSIAEQGRLSGASEIIVGTLTRATAENVSNSGNPYASGTKYSGIVSFSLQLIDVETGVLKEQQIFSGDNKVSNIVNKLADGLKVLNKDRKASATTDLTNVTSDLVTADTKEAAIANAIRSSEKLVSKWITGLFPPNIKLLQVQERTGNGVPETVLITGIASNVKKGTQITINEVVLHNAGDGQKLRQVIKIGELKVRERQGDVTLCKITGGNSVLEEKIKNGAKLEFYIQ